MAGRAVAQPPRVRPLTPGDADAVAAVHTAGIDTGDATFETAAPGWEAFDRGKLGDHRFAAELPEAPEVLVGWAAVSPTSTRAVYAGVVEVSVYVAAAARGRGVGSALLGALVTSTEAAGIWTLQAGIFPENVASLALHERAGFRRVGLRERLGRMAVGARAGQWRDVVLLERRSDRVG